MRPNLHVCCFSLLFLLHSVGAKPASELQVSLPARARAHLKSELHARFYAVMEMSAKVSESRFSRRV